MVHPVSAVCPPPDADQLQNYNFSKTRRRRERPRNHFDRGLPRPVFPGRCNHPAGTHGGTALALRPPPRMLNDLVSSYGYEAMHGRKKRWPERVGAKFAAGTLDRIAVPLADGEKEPPSFAKRSSASSSAGKRPRQKPFRRSEARLCGPVTSDENIIIGGDSRTLPR